MRSGCVNLDCKPPLGVMAPRELGGAMSESEPELHRPMSAETKFHFLKSGPRGAVFMHQVKPWGPAPCFNVPW